MLEWILATFAAGALAFWLVLIAAVVTLYWLESESDWFWSAVLIGALLLFLQFVAQVNVFGFLWHHPFWSATIVLLYLAAGGGNFLLQWWSYVVDQHDKFHELVYCDAEHEAAYLNLRERFYDEHGLNHLEEVPAGLNGDFNAKLHSHYFGFEYHPLVRSHKKDAYVWIAFWPWSLSRLMLKDPLLRAAKFVYNVTAAYAQSISDAVWQRAHEDYKNGLARRAEAKDRKSGGEGNTNNA